MAEALVNYRAIDGIAVIELSAPPANCYSVLPGTGGTQRLARLVGKARAIELTVCGMNMDFERAAELALERELQQQLFQSADAREGIVAYNEKRKPEFEGK